MPFVLSSRMPPQTPDLPSEQEQNADFLARFGNSSEATRSRKVTFFVATRAASSPSNSLYSVRLSSSGSRSCRQVKLANVRHGSYRRRRCNDLNKRSRTRRSFTTSETSCSRASRTEHESRTQLAPRSSPALAGAEESTPAAAAISPEAITSPQLAAQARCVCMHHTHGHADMDRGLCFCLSQVVRCLRSATHVAHKHFTEKGGTHDVAY